MSPHSLAPEVPPVWRRYRGPRRPLLSCELTAPFLWPLSTSAEPFPAPLRTHRNRPLAVRVGRLAVCRRPALLAPCPTDVRRRARPPWKRPSRAGDRAAHQLAVLRRVHGNRLGRRAGGPPVGNEGGPQRATIDERADGLLQRYPISRRTT